MAILAVSAILGISTEAEATDRFPKMVILDGGSAWTPSVTDCHSDCISTNGDEVVVCEGDQVTVSFKVQVSGVKWRSTKWNVESQTDGCDNFEPDYQSDGLFTETFVITAPDAPGTYDLTVHARSNDACSEGTSGKITLQNAIIVRHKGPEVCDGIDNDCDGRVDEGLNCDFCGQTVDACIYLMMDRTGSTNAPSRASEAGAAKMVLDFFKTASDPPPIAVGVFGCNGSGFPGGNACTRQGLSDTENPAPYGDNDGNSDSDHYAFLDQAAASASSVGTHFISALNKASDGLSSCTESHRILLFLSDGGNEDDAAATLAAATTLKNGGIEIFTILFPGASAPTQADVNEMKAVASSLDHFFQAPSADDLEDIFELIVDTLGCDDGDMCTADTCLDGVCAHKDTDCDDDNPCTYDNCDNGVCSHPPVPAGTACGSSANTICDNPDTCDANGVCQPNNEPNSTRCRGGLFCNGPESCQGECGQNSDCPDDTNNPCTIPVCTDGNCGFTFATVGTLCGSSANTDCDNPDTCTAAGVCQANQEPNGTPCTADSNSCTSDLCSAGVCVHNALPASTACGSPTNDVCTDPDTCDATGTCRPNDAPDGTNCLDGLFCDGPETCRGGKCSDGPDPCQSLAHCIEASDTCLLCLSSTECNDDNPCTSDVCNPPTGCTHPLVTCNDGNPCTTDSCDPTDGCRYDPSENPCNDENQCTDDDRCVEGECMGTPIPACSCQSRDLLLDTELTLMAADLDLRQETTGPAITKARFDVWNQNEVRFSGTERCISCWDAALLGLYNPPNHFLIGVLQTNKGKTRIEGIPSNLCPGSRDVGLVGISMKELSCPRSGPQMRSAMELRGIGGHSAVVRYDTFTSNGRSVNESAEAAASAAPTFSDDSTLSGVPFEGPSITEGAVVANRGSITEKGSVIFWPKVEVRWNAAGEVIQDTFLSLVNDTGHEVSVRLFLINGDPPLEAVIVNGELVERAHPGWNKYDVQLTLTAEQPTYWSAYSGYPAGVSVWDTLDPGPPPGRPDPDPRNPNGRMLRGFVVGWAVNAQGEEIRWNHLSGSAVIIHYDDTTAAEYLGWAFQCVSGVAEGSPCDDVPGQILLDGMEYDAVPNQLVFDFYASGSKALAHPFGEP